MSLEFESDFFSFFSQFFSFFFDSHSHYFTIPKYDHHRPSHVIYADWHCCFHVPWNFKPIHMIHRIVRWKLNHVRWWWWWCVCVIWFHNQIIYYTIEFLLCLCFFCLFIYSTIIIKIKKQVSYTTKDLIFDWEESDSLVVEEHIELPQHDLINKDIDYCTTDYSSGMEIFFYFYFHFNFYSYQTNILKKFFSILMLLNSGTFACVQVVFTIKRRIGK